VLVRYDAARLRANLAALTDGRASADDVLRFIEAEGVNAVVDSGTLDGPGLHAAYLRGVGVRDDYAAFASAWNDVFTPMLGIELLLDRLQGRYPLVVLSNTNAIHAEHLRAELPLLARFDALIFSCEIGAVKPEPVAYAAAVAATGVAASACLFLDDSETNVAGARAAGLQAIHFSDVPAAEAQLRALGVI
jgi:glucose-1-phosphatase